jgi:hypothetical protein
MIVASLFKNFFEKKNKTIAHKTLRITERDLAEKSDTPKIIIQKCKVTICIGGF